MSAAIDAFEHRHVATVDVEGAFLHCDMVNTVVMSLDPILSAMMVQLSPETYEPYIGDDGRLLVQLDKALYGCVESAKLFYDHVAKTLTDYGFIRNPYDICVFNKIIHNKQCTVTIHVDDLKISCSDRRGVDDVIDELVKVYKKINVWHGPIIDYLGMEFDYSSPDAVTISMSSMIEEVLQEYEVDSTVKTPAGHNLHKVREDSPPLTEREREEFHSCVAKLLYIAKRARPDLLTAIGFLCTRVSCSTQDDNSKLIRVLKYLNGTKDMTLRLSGSNGMIISAWVDAAFAVHKDGKGQTGAVISIGGGAVYSKSSKQKLVAKSSTEAELIGVSDALTQILWTRHFLSEQGYNTSPAIVHQDNQSTILLAEKGRSVSGRTRHVSIRYFFIKDNIDRKEVVVQYTNTNDMVADFFTKPLQGSLFDKHRKTILNHT
jgi:hypothetical protein